MKTIKVLLMLVLASWCISANAIPILSLGSGTAIDDIDATATFDSVVDGTDLSTYSEDGLNITADGLANVTWIEASNNIPDSVGGFGGTSSGGFFYTATSDFNVLSYVGGSTIFGLEFNIGSGYFDDWIFGNTLFGWETYEDGILTGSGEVLITLGEVVGISDLDGFDEIHLWNSRSESPTINLLAMDNLQVDLTPVPEAPAFPMFLIGLAMLVVYRCQKM